MPDSEKDSRYAAIAAQYRDLAEYRVLRGDHKCVPNGTLPALSQKHGMPLRALCALVHRENWRHLVEPESSCLSP